MDGEKSTLEKVTETVKEAMETIVEGAKSMVSPESDTPINMPHNESGAEIERAAKMKKRPAKKAPIPTRNASQAPQTSRSTSPRPPTRPRHPRRSSRLESRSAVLLRRHQQAGCESQKSCAQDVEKEREEIRQGTAKKAKKTTGKKSASKKPAKTSKKKTSKRRR